MTFNERVEVPSQVLPAGTYFQYRVEGTEFINPADVQVLHQTKDAELTLVTCYPFYYAGSAPKRFIVHAKAV